LICIKINVIYTFQINKTPNYLILFLLVQNLTQMIDMMDCYNSTIG